MFISGQILTQDNQGSLSNARVNMLTYTKYYIYTVYYDAVDLFCTYQVRMSRSTHNTHTNKLMNVHMYIRSGTH